MKEFDSKPANSKSGSTFGHCVWTARIVCATVVAVAVASASPSAWADIYGTMSNFDVFNQTPSNAYGAELELEGIHSSEIFQTYPSHYNNVSITDYTNGSIFGTHVIFTGYNFDPSGYLAPSIGTSTNGHACVDTPGCEHFGFSVSVQPATTRYFWLDENSQRIGTTPLSIPNPSWTYVPPAIPGNPPVLQAAIQAPEPEDPDPLLPDAVWVKVYETQLERPVELDELISNGAVVPEDEVEVETEWELLAGNEVLEADSPLEPGMESVIRRYEYYQYLGAYSSEHEPLSAWAGGDPPVDELGAFIAANMVAANLVAPVPEPASYMLGALGLICACWTVRRFRLRRVMPAAS